MKSVKDILRKLIIGFLLVYVIYVIYILYLSTIKNIEGYSNTLDCSNCEMKPGNSGNCMSIMDVSYNYMNNNMDISFLDTSYVFCEWEPNCPNLNNIISQSERLDISKADMVNNKGKRHVNVISIEGYENKKDSKKRVIESRKVKLPEKEGFIKYLHDSMKQSIKSSTPT